MTIPRHTMTSGASMLRSSTGSTPKTVCKSPKVKGVYVAKGKYIECANDVVYVTEGKYGEYAKEDASIKEGHNEPLTKEGNNKSLAKNGDWLGTMMSPLPQGQLAAYVMQDDDEPLATRASDRVRRARQR
jgi:hypothetical protein